MQTFVKAVNYNHLMPTRYTLDVDLKGVVGPESLENSSKKTEARKVRRMCPLDLPLLRRKIPLVLDTWISIARCHAGRQAAAGYREHMQHAPYA